MIKIGSNIQSLIVQRQLGRATADLSTTYERLASGQRINRASDDAAGLAVSSQLNIDARLANRARLNVSDGISVLQTASAATDALTEIVSRVRELAEQSATGTYSQKQREALNTEAQALAGEYNRIRESTTFNNRKLINGDSADLSIFAGIRGAGAALQVGIRNINGGQENTGSALVLDGVNDSLVVAHDASHLWRGEDFTVELMANIDPTESDGGFLIAQSFNGSGEYNYVLAYAPDGSITFTNWGVDGTGASVISSLAAAPGTLKPGEWQHIAMSYGTDRTLRLFVEGKKVAESILPANFRFTSTLPESLTDLAIGTIYPSPETTSYPSFYLTKGSLDQIKLSKVQKYTQDFTPTRIQQNVDASTVLLLNFESSSGLSHVDSSPNHMAATARNGATISTGYQSKGGNLAAFDLRFQADARDALTLTASVLENISAAKGEIAASMSRLMIAANSLSSLEINSKQAASRILDADVAEESAVLVRTKILQQASTAVLAQANLQPSIALRLLKN